MAFTSKNPKFDSTVLTDIAATTPSNPAASSNKIVNRNGVLYIRDSAGNETPVGVGSGELNVIAAPSTASGWVSSNASNITVATSTTSSDLPLSAIIGTAIKITPISGTDYIRYRFTIPAALKQRKLKIQFDMRPLSGYATGDLKVDMYTNAASNYGGAYTRLALSTDSSAVSAIPNLTGRYTTTFDTANADYYELRIGRVAGTTAANFANVIVGPGIQPQGAVIGTATVSAPVVGGLGAGGVVSSQLVWVRNGQFMHISGFIKKDGTPGSGSAAVTVTVPGGLTIDTNAVTSGSPNENNFGIFDDINNSRIGYVSCNPASPTLLTFIKTVTSAVLPGSDLAASYPFNFDCIIPIAEWAGSGTVNLAQNNLQYLFNSSTSTSASDTTSFGYGSQGAVIQNITAALNRRCRSAVPLVGKNIYVQINEGTGWVTVCGLSANAQNINEYTVQGTLTYGISSTVAIINDTDFDVKFGQYAYANSATYAAAGSAWSSNGGSTVLWRAVVVDPGSAVGFGLATASQAGLVSGGTVPGITTGVAIGVGYIGEKYESTAVTATIPNAAGNITSIANVPAGRYTCTGLIAAKGGTATSYMEVTVTTVSGTMGTLGLNRIGSGGNTTSNYASAMISGYILDLAAPTTVYLVGVSQATLTNDGYYRLTLVRCG